MAKIRPFLDKKKKVYHIFLGPPHTSPVLCNQPGQERHFRGFL